MRSVYFQYPVLLFGFQFIQVYIMSLINAFCPSNTLADLGAYVCRNAYLELCRIRPFVTISPLMQLKLICAFVLSRMDHCNFLLNGIPKYLFDRLQRIQINAAYLIFRHISPIWPIICSLHSLPVVDCIAYKLSNLTQSAISGICPQYLSELTSIYMPSRLLPSSSYSKLLESH